MAKKFDHQVLKNCFSQFATGVMIATTSYKGKNYGLTINSFSSISLDPALVLFSIGNDSYNLKFFKKSKKFCLNILSENQLELAREFAKVSNGEKWQFAEFFLSQKANPIFKNISAFIDCKKYKTIKLGDHHVFIGEIIEIEHFRIDEPLLYFNGQFYDW